MASKKSNTNVEKSIYFTFLLYPESLPVDWKMQLELTGRPIAISPLHDSDLVSQKELDKLIRQEEEFLSDNRYIFTKQQKDNCEKRILDLKTKPRFKKSHYHVIYVAKNNVTADAVRKKIQRLLGAQAVNKVQIIATSVRNTYDYLTHESIDAIAKKKHVYSKDDIVTLNNFDIDRYDELDSADKKAYLNTVLNLVKSNCIQNMIDLEFFIDERGSEYGVTNSILRDVVDGKSGILRLYFDGNYQRDKRKKEQDKENQLKQQSETDVLNDMLVESNWQLKKQIEDMKNQMKLLKDEIPEIVDYVTFDEEEK